MGTGHHETGTEKREVKLGVIGYGYWGPNLARNFLDLEGARVKEWRHIMARELVFACSDPEDDLVPTCR